MHKETSAAPLWQFPITAMPDAPPEPADPMEMIARWQQELEAAPPVADADNTSPRKTSRRRR